MKLITKEKLHKILADEGKHIRDIKDKYIPEHYDDDGNLMPEHIPYYATIIYVPDNFTEEMMDKNYIEENIEE